MFKCKFCLKEYKREKTLFSHVCEQKRRYQARNDKTVQIALDTYLKFYKLTQRVGKVKNYDDFVKSPYYTAFVKFGSFCINTNVISIPRYTTHLIKDSVRLDDWTSDKCYSTFLQNYIRNEDVDHALTRTIEYSIKWGKEKEMNSHDLFRYGSMNRVCQALIDGKISPWVLYLSSSGNQFLEEVNLSYIYDIIEPDYWTNKFEKNKDDVDFAKTVLTLGGW